MKHKEVPKASISCQLDQTKAKNVEKNTILLKCVIEALEYCGKQCIALRSDHENLNKYGNPGNFLAYLKRISRHTTVLAEHLSAPKMKNLTYMSPQTQNELLEIIAEHYIVGKVLLYHGR